MNINIYKFYNETSKQYAYVLFIDGTSKHGAIITMLYPESINARIGGYIVIQARCLIQPVLCKPLQFAQLWEGTISLKVKSTVHVQQNQPAKE